MRILKIIGIVVLMLIAIAVVLGLVKAGPYSITETADIKGNPDVIWKNISDLNKFAKWNPWGKLDPNMKTTFTGEPGAVGSVYAWEGNKKVGSGSMTNTEVVAGQKVTSDLHFLTPMDAHCKTVFAMTPNADGSQKVSWTMDGENKFPGSIFTALMGFEGMMRKSFQEGFGYMQTIVEEESKNAPAPSSGTDYKIEEKQYAGNTFITIRNKIKVTEISKFFADNYAKMGEALGKNKIEPTGQPCGIYYMFDMEKGETDLAAAMSVPAGTKIDGYTMVVVPPSPYYHLDYYGDYAKSYPAYEALDKYAIAKGKEPKPEMVIEQYVNDPMLEKDTAKWLTAIHYFLK